MGRKSLVQGVGVNDSEDLVKVNGVKIESYKLWQSMLQRCYSEKYHQRRPTYKGCSVCEEWKYFSNFKRWFEVHYRTDENGKAYHLDKDLLVKGNKLYSPETCVFVPPEVNIILLQSEKSRGEYPIGVSWDKTIGKIKAQVSVKSKNKNLGYFNTTEEAYQAYKKAKEDHVKQLAEEYFSEGKICRRTYEALLVWQVEDND